MQTKETFLEFLNSSNISEDINSKQLLAPNGKPSNLNALQYKMVRTKEFKNWFGDWENDPHNASKIVDENGEPLVVYHGTNSNFTQFRKDTIGKGGGETLGKGFYFTPNKQNASYFSSINQQDNANVMLTFLNIKNPLIVNNVKEYYSIIEHEKTKYTNIVQRDQLRSKRNNDILHDAGFDGILLMFNNNINEIVAFEPNQIKSAIGNTGNYSTEHDDINENSKETFLDFLTESTLQYHKTLHKTFWKNKQLDPLIQKHLLKIANEFYKFLELDTKVFKIQDIIFTGSLCNYNYTKYSDIDLHLILSPTSKQCEDCGIDLEKTLEHAKNLFNCEHDISIYDYPVELYAQLSDAKLDAAGIYSIKNNKWVSKPSFEKIKYDNKLIDIKSKQLIKKIDSLVSSKSNDHEQLRELSHKLKRYRQSGLNKVGEFGFENLVYKNIRNLGYLDKLKKAKINALDDKLSLYEAKKHTVKTITEIPKNGLWFIHQSPEMLSIIKPQTYKSLKKIRDKDYPLADRYNQENEYRNLLHTSNDTSFTYATILNHHKMSTPTDYDGYTYYFKLNDVQIESCVFDIVDAKKWMNPTKGKKGLEKALKLWEENKKSFKPTNDKNIGTIYPRIEVIIPFNVYPEFKYPQKEDRHINESLSLYESLENTISFDNIPKLYHLSTDKNLKTLTPRIPRDVKIRKNAFEDSTIPRISFSESIEGCILGLQINEKDFKDGKIQFHVYSPTNGEFLSNNELNRKKYVFDSKITKEWWGLSKTDVEKIGIIEVSEKGFKKISFKPLKIGDKKLLKPDGTLETFSYPYKWIDENIKESFLDFYESPDNISLHEEYDISHKLFRQKFRKHELGLYDFYYIKLEPILNDEDLQKDYKSLQPYNAEKFMRMIDDNYKKSHENRKKLANHLLTINFYLLDKSYKEKYKKLLNDQYFVNTISTLGSTSKSHIKKIIDDFYNFSFKESFLDFYESSEDNLYENFINPTLKHTNYTYDDLVQFEWDDLCMMAYGVKNGDIIKLKPSDIKIKYKDDLVNPRYKFEQGGMKWCRSVSFEEPVKVSLGLNGKDTKELWYLEDGHHRHFCSKKLKMPYIVAEVEQINLKAINKILKQQNDFKLGLLHESYQNSEQSLDTNFKSNIPNLIIEFIKQNCKPFLNDIRNDLSNILYRGMSLSRHDDRISAYVSNGFYHNRKTSGLSLENHNHLNELFKQKFNIPFMDGIFTTGSKVQADEYGYVYAIFPIGNYNFVYNPKINDMFYGLEYGKQNPNDLIDGYKSDDIKNAIKSKKEIILYADKLLYVPIDILDEIIKDFNHHNEPYKESFLEFYESSNYKTLNDVKQYWDSLNIDYSLHGNDDYIELSKIIVPKTSRNIGIGSKALQALTDYADYAQKTIILTPSSDFGGSKSRLESFYKNFEFVHNKGKNKNYYFRETMYRKPKVSLNESHYYSTIHDIEDLFQSLNIPFMVIENSGKIVLDDSMIKYLFKNIVNGTKALKALNEYAENAGKTIIGFLPKTYDKRLLTFLKSLGFIKEKLENKVYRYPK